MYLWCGLEADSLKLSREKMKVSKATHNHVLSFLEPPLRLAEWKPSKYGKQITICI